MNQEKTTQLATEMEAFMQKHQVSASDLMRCLEQKSMADADRQCREIAQSHLDLVGRCFVIKVKPHNGLFPEMNRYIKVLSVQSENEYRVECLVFDALPYYWFDYRAHRVHQRGDYYLGSFEFDSFRTISILAKDFSRMTEISEEDFCKAARIYLEELLKMQWTAEHYRLGGKLPLNDGWRKTDVESK